ncbi:MAG: hypothetical protein LBG60_09990 [Bifidobacteriaceae bacterium]|jgi:hypothetical protein|nr:hypothetical protein [Bifidobacteriaceae bacterium]
MAANPRRSQRMFDGGQARAIVAAAVAGGTGEPKRSLGEVFAVSPDAANVDLPWPPRRK